MPAAAAARAARLRRGRDRPTSPDESARHRAADRRTASGSARSISSPRANWPSSRTGRLDQPGRARGAGPGGQPPARLDRQPQPRGPRAAARRVRGRSTAISAACSRPCSKAARRISSWSNSDDPLEAGLEIMAQPPGKRLSVAHPALGRRAGADRGGADLRAVPHQSRADLRARRGRCAARRRQYRALLRPARPR